MKKGSLMNYWFSSVQSLSHVQLFATPWTASCQPSLSITNCQSLLKLMSIELVISSNHLILCLPFLLLPSVFPIIRVFSNESVLHIRSPKYWSFSFSISPSNEYSGLISFRMDWLDVLYWYHYGKQYGLSSKKLKTELPYSPAIPSLGIYLKKTKTLIQKDRCPDTRSRIIY